MKQYDNVLVYPFPDREDGLHRYAIFDCGKVHVCSLGLYNSSVGVEWVISPTGGEIHRYCQVDVTNSRACCHWIFDYVDADTIKVPASIEIYDLARAGDFDGVFKAMAMYL